jgi:hypothetical protein
MHGALTPPFAVAALVLCVAGVAKLRAPAGAANALSAGGIPVGQSVVRVFALFELVLGGWCVLAPELLDACALAAVYAIFAALSLLLARRRAACGCFGERETPASAIQSLLSATLAAGAGMAAIWPPHGAGWMLGHAAVILVFGTAGAVFGIVVAYTELPQAWAAWSPR